MRGETIGSIAAIAITVVFQSTLPMRGETEKFAGYEHRRTISIHSPHAGRDIVKRQSKRRYSDFNPLSPCGERPVGIRCIRYQD